MRPGFIVAFSIILTLAVPAEGYAQTTTSPTAPVTGMKPDRTTAPAGVREAMQKREAVKRRNRAECRAKASAEKVPLLKRAAYIKSCRAQSN